MSTDPGTCREPAGSGPRGLQAMPLHDVHTGRLTVLRAAALFDGVSPALMAEPSVVVAGGTIAAVVGPAGPRYTSELRLVVVDLGRKAPAQASDVIVATGA
jgi:hypothetical protein